MSTTAQDTTTTTHTPGPWSYTLRRSSAPCCGATTSSIGYVSADTGHIEIAVLYHHGQQEANLRLIAAAPDLLAALKAIAFRLAAVVLATGDFSDVNAKAIDYANAVVSKAEGTQSHDQR